MAQSTARSAAKPFAITADCNPRRLFRRPTESLTITSRRPPCGYSGSRQWVALARRMHNDAVRDTRALRHHQLMRWLHLQLMRWLRLAGMPYPITLGALLNHHPNRHHQWAV